MEELKPNAGTEWIVHSLVVAKYPRGLYLGDSQVICRRYPSDYLFELQPINTLPFQSDNR